jgi:nucleoside-diphosphate-sugar epimerase
LAATVPGIEGEIFNLGGGEEIAIRDVVKTVLDVMGNPIAPAIGALPDRPTEIWRMFCDSTKARERLGWSPKHSLRDGLERTIEWYRTELDGSGSAYET